MAEAGWAADRDSSKKAAVQIESALPPCCVNTGEASAVLLSKSKSEF
jgi:hypothetical protein